MGAASTTDIIIGILLVLLVIVAIWAVVEIAITVRKARSTVDEAQKVIQQAEPLIDHVTLTVDAANLEIMRLDGILENVNDITQSASSVAEAVNKVSNAPIQLATSIANRFRIGTKSMARERRMAHALTHGQDDSRRLDGASLSGEDDIEESNQAKQRHTHGITIIDPSPVRSREKDNVTAREDSSETTADEATVASEAAPAADGEGVSSAESA